MNRSDSLPPPDSFDPGSRRAGTHAPSDLSLHLQGAPMDQPPASSPEFSDADQLHPQDAAALDALVHAAFRVEGVPADQRPVAQVLTGLLSLLDRGSAVPADEGVLLNLTMARISRQRHEASAGSPAALLSALDDEALEALVSAEFETSRVPAGLRSRARRAEQLLGLLDAAIPAPAPGSDGASSQLLDRTLSRVQRAIEEHEQSMAVPGGDRRGGWSFRMQDLVSVAALLLVAASLIGPMLMGLREYNRRVACGSNMQVAGVAFGQYGYDSKGLLPVATSSTAGNPWWYVGQGAEKSNSANLYVLNRANFTTVEKLACCGNPSAPTEAPSDAVDWRSINEVSYSYQCQFAERRPAWNSGARVIILSDASPVVRRALRGELIDPFENSFNHAGRGQNVLFNDGSSAWLTTPVVDTGRSDNIWLPKRIECEIAKLTRPNHAKAIKGNESPDSEEDTFVGP